MFPSNHTATGQGGQRGRLELVGERLWEVRLAAKQWLVEGAGSLIVAAEWRLPRGDECDESAKVIGVMGGCDCDSMCISCTDRAGVRCTAVVVLAPLLSVPLIRWQIGNRFC